MNWYLAVLKKYAVFGGRARRKEYWLFLLFNLMITVILGAIDHVAGLAGSASVYGPLGALYGLAILVPGLAVSVRRLHDTNHSGWWLLVALVPFIGAIVLLIFMIRDSQPGQNQHGPNPKGASA